MPVVFQKFVLNKINKNESFSMQEQKIAVIFLRDGCLNTLFLWVDSLLLVCSNFLFMFSFMVPNFKHSHKPCFFFVSRLPHAMPSIFFRFYCYYRVCAWFPFFISVDYFVSVELFFFLHSLHIFHFASSSYTPII